ncbi:hypothetical protein V500_02088 [Pseudogymnoascus sp. VKM F-4518 (FW-2643)]|nr:hypothetical protein V500_02088 [Pseudogymnoascus sp. VKM F-4518 (FW-2643)]
MQGSEFHEGAVNYCSRGTVEGALSAGYSPLIVWGPAVAVSIPISASSSLIFQLHEIRAYSNLSDQYICMFMIKPYVITLRKAGQPMLPKDQEPIPNPEANSQAA